MTPHPKCGTCGQPITGTLYVGRENGHPTYRCGDCSAANALSGKPPLDFHGNTANAQDVARYVVDKMF